MAKFDERLARCWPSLSPAERAVAHFFRDNRAEVLIASAAALAEQAGSSDATVVRTAKALGYKGLADLRRELAAQLQATATPAERLGRTLAEIGTADSVLAAVLALHAESLERLRQDISDTLFNAAVAALSRAPRILVFGIGPSGALADYFATQLSRFGREAAAITRTGLLLADDLQHLRARDLVVILAYGRVYPELNALLAQARSRQAKTILITDTLAAELGGRVDMLLPAPRGRATSLSLHGATLVLLEALLVGLASAHPRETLASLKSLNETRRRLAGDAAKLSE